MDIDIRPRALVSTLILVAALSACAVVVSGNVARGGELPDGCAAAVASQPWPDLEAACRVVQGPTPACPTGESGGDPGAYSNGNRGLFQVNEVHAWRVGGDLSSLYDPYVNTRVAYDIFVDNGGWGPWSCKPGRVSQTSSVAVIGWPDTGRAISKLTECQAWYVSMFGKYHHGTMMSISKVALKVRTNC